MTPPRAKPQTTVPPPTEGAQDGQAFAQFWRCALQVNPASYSAKYRGDGQGLGEDAYNSALAEKCVELNIKVVGIADHSSVDAVDKLRGVLEAQGVVVFPGFEIASTEKVHMVCLFPEGTTRDQLNQFIGELGLAGAENATRPSKYGCVDLATRVQNLGGFWYAAHATSANGLSRLGSKDGGGLPHIWQDCKAVHVIQIPGPIEDLPQNYRQIISNQNADYRRDRPVVVINAKDVAKPEDLDEPGASTWIKMTEPSFAAFKIAFLDSESRVRLDLSETPHSALLSLRISGGYLDGLHARFSDHLNAVIGGRGTGKSTLLECIRYTLDLSPKGKQALALHQSIVKENLGKASGTVELRVRSTAQHSEEFTVSRRFGEPPIVRDGKGAVSQQQPQDLLPGLEIYGQNEIFELAQSAENRRRLLDRFLPEDSTSSDTRAQLRKKLTTNAEKLLKAETERDDVEEQVRKLPKLQEQLEGFKKLGIEVKLASVPLFAREKQLATRVDEEVARLTSAIASLRENLPDLTFLSDKALENLPNQSDFKDMRETLQQLHGDTQKVVSQFEETLKRTQEKLQLQKQGWNQRRLVGEQELAAAIENIPDMAGKSGREVGTAYKTLSQDIERIQPLQTKVNNYAQLLTALRAERQELLANLSALRSKRDAELRRAVEKLNTRLKGKIRIDLGVAGARSKLVNFLASSLDGIGEKRLEWVNDQAVTPIALARKIDDGAEALQAAFGVTSSMATALFKLSKAKLLELESLELEDAVEIELNVAHSGPERYRKLFQLSTGQQCTAVLHLLLLDNPDPLIMDQPEDNLDNAFIAERIVQELRASKTERQFLFSTHNANIPVFGDAEWIGVLTAGDSKGELPPGNQGSIDVPAIREQAAEILEGGPNAFNRRKEMYGF